MLRIFDFIMLIKILCGVSIFTLCLILSITCKIEEPYLLSLFYLGGYTSMLINTYMDKMNWK